MASPTTAPMTDIFALLIPCGSPWAVMYWMPAKPNITKLIPPARAAINRPTLPKIVLNSSNSLHSSPETFSSTNQDYRQGLTTGF